MPVYPELLVELERLADRAPPGRSAAVRNEAMRLIWRRLKRPSRVSASGSSTVASFAPAASACVQPLRWSELKTSAAAAEQEHAARRRSLRLAHGFARYLRAETSEFACARYG